MSLYVAAYDVAHDDHRQHVARVLLQYGRRVQRSVFEIDLTPEEVAELKQQLGPWLAADDAFDLFPLDTRDPARRISWYHAPGPEDVVLML